MNQIRTPKKKRPRAPRVPPAWAAAASRWPTAPPWHRRWCWRWPWRGWLGASGVKAPGQKPGLISGGSWGFFVVIIGDVIVIHEDLMVIWWWFDGEYLEYPGNMIGISWEYRRNIYQFPFGIPFWMVMKIGKFRIGISWEISLSIPIGFAGNQLKQKTHGFFDPQIRWQFRCLHKFPSSDSTWGQDFWH